MSEKTNGEQSDGPVIDPDVKEELQQNFPEDPILTEYATSGKGGGESEKVDVTSEWIGEKGDWKPKTKLSAEQIIAMTQVRMMGDTFDELEEISPILDSMVENIEEYAVSHMGMAREQHVRVLEAMHGNPNSEDDTARNALMNALAMPVENDE